MQMLEFVHSSGPEPWKTKNANRFVRSHAMKDFRRKQRENAVQKRRKDGQSKPANGSLSKFPLANEKIESPAASNRLPNQDIATGPQKRKNASAPLTATSTLGEVAWLKNISPEVVNLLYPQPPNSGHSGSILPPIFPAQDIAGAHGLPSPSPSSSSDRSASPRPRTADVVRSVPQDFDLSVCTKVYAALDSCGANFEQFTKHYFRSVHHYVTIVHRYRFLKSVYKLRKKANAEVAVLLLCIRLVAEPVESGISTEGGDLYSTAKRLWTSTCTTKGPLLELIQAGCLLTLYEHNSYMSVSYDTLKDCSNMSSALGLHAHPTGNVSVAEEERRRVYWGLLALNCIVALHDEKHEKPLLFPVPSPEDALPSISDTEFDNASNEICAANRGFIVQSKLPTWSDSFSRQGQSVRLMFMVQSILHEQFDQSPDIMIARIALLDSLIVSNLHNLLKDCNGKATQYCGPISMLISASFLLHGHTLSATMHCAPEQKESLDAATRSKLAGETMIEMTISILHEFPVSHTPELSPAALFCPYMAAMLSLQLDRINGLRHPPTLNSETFELMVGGLRHFSTLWPCTAEYIKLIKRAQSRALPLPQLSDG